MLGSRDGWGYAALTNRCVGSVLGPFCGFGGMFASLTYIHKIHKNIVRLKTRLTPAIRAASRVATLQTKVFGNQNVYLYYEIQKTYVLYVGTNGVPEALKRPELDTGCIPSSNKT